jgi:hypothetical protein
VAEIKAIPQGTAKPEVNCFNWTSFAESELDNSTKYIAKKQCSFMINSKSPADSAYLEK